MNSHALRIKKISIKNFRSIIEANHIELDDLNIIVGNNDQGKSNILRALNLFFNHGRQSGTAKYNFQQDYCLFAKKIEKKAAEIVIELTIQPPHTYGEGRLVKWKKVWRADGYQSDKERIVYEDNTELPQKSRLPSLLRVARFEYVPAIKGPDYFAQILGDLHDMLALTVEEKMREAAQSFTATINSHTADILTELKRRLGWTSSIELPPDLRELFSRLDFASIISGRQLSFQQRGDGIKVRHIPVVLQFLAAQANLNKVRGKPPVYTIWGYEEPENNLELSKSIEVAKEFQAYSNEIQILLTTHSPAFYSLSKRAGGPVKLISVSTDTQRQTIIRPIDHSHLERIDAEMGLIAFVAPYLERASAEKKALQAKLEVIERQNRPTLFVEGRIDEKVITRAISLLRPNLLDQIHIQTEDNGGANYVKDMLIAWAHSGKPHKAMGLFDDDTAGREAIKEVNNNEKAKNSSEVKCLRLQAPPHLDGIKKRYKIEIRLEELLTPECWIKANANKWLEQRPQIIIQNPAAVELDFTTPIPIGMPLTPEQSVFVQGQICEDKKQQFANYVCGLNGAQAFVNFERTLDKIEKYLVGVSATSS